ncbi:hypothetical protein LC065_15145 [Halobacillus litoralis]|nr:hypothetical protein [Halobacillus litoralis]WLR46876.1 hypothetical protein LC065_15145 [Halobacillus litoralis]
MVHETERSGCLYTAPASFMDEGNERSASTHWAFVTGNHPYAYDEEE